MTIDRVLRTASLEKSDAFDRRDIARTTPEERLAVVERLRQEYGKTVPIIGRSALIANKRASGRPKDAADLASLAAYDAGRRRRRG